MSTIIQCLKTVVSYVLSNIVVAWGCPGQVLDTVSWLHAEVHTWFLKYFCIHHWISASQEPREANNIASEKMYHQ